MIKRIMAVYRRIHIPVRGWRDVYMKNRRPCFSLSFSARRFFLFLFLSRQTVAQSSLWTKEQLWCWENVLAKKIDVRARNITLVDAFFLFARLSPSPLPPAVPLPPPPSIFWLLLFLCRFVFVSFLLAALAFFSLSLSVPFCYWYSPPFPIFNLRVSISIRSDFSRSFHCFFV